MGLSYHALAPGERASHALVHYSTRLISEGTYSSAQHTSYDEEKWYSQSKTIHGQMEQSNQR